MILTNTFHAFRHRDYFIFWCGLLLGHTGTLIQTTAQSWLIFQLTNSPFYLGLEGLFLGLPRVLFSAFGGAVVDRYDRKKIFVITQSAFLLMALFIGVMDHGAGAILGGLTLASVRRFPKPHRLLFFLAAGFGTTMFFFATSRSFPLSLVFLFIAGGFQTTFLSFTATLLQLRADETNRGRIMSLFGLINRGLGPMGSFPSVSSLPPSVPRSPSPGAVC